MPRLTDARKLAAKGRGSALVNVLVVTELLPPIDWPETGLEEITCDFLEVSGPLVAGP
jgi:hypothetical protein